MKGEKTMNNTIKKMMTKKDSIIKKKRELTYTPHRNAKNERFTAKTGLSS